MGEKSKVISNPVDAERRIYAAPALEKGLDILEILCKSEGALSQKEIAQQRIAANVAAIEATLVLDTDALTVTGGKEALAIVAEANGSNMDEIKRVQDRKSVV